MDHTLSVPQSAIQPPEQNCAHTRTTTTTKRPIEGGAQGTLQIVPVTFDEACGFVSMWHRHHQPPVGHKYSLGVADGERLVGVAIVGRPVARAYNDGRTLEVNRTCTDGTANANSMLYAAAWKVAKNLGYRRLITYTQDGESGSSLTGAGWRVYAQRPARRGWNMPSRPRDGHGNDGIARTLWEMVA